MARRRVLTLTRSKSRRVEVHLVLAASWSLPPVFHIWSFMDHRLWPRCSKGVLYELPLMARCSKGVPYEPPLMAALFKRTDYERLSSGIPSRRAIKRRICGGISMTWAFSVASSCSLLATGKTMVT